MNRLPDDNLTWSGRIAAALKSLATPGAAYGTLLFALTFWIVLFPLTNTDIWWHLSAGRRMFETGGFIYADPFSYAAEGQKWIDVHWLFQIIAYCVHSMSGVSGLVVFKAASFGLACTLLFATCYRKETAAAAVALISLAAYSMRFLILVRPIVFTLVFLAGFVLVLERYRATKRARLLLLLPLIQIAWVNIQGLHILGPVTLACYLAGEALALVLSRIRSEGIGFQTPLSRCEYLPLMYAFIGTCLAMVVSPYGLDAALLPFALFTRVEPALGDLYSWNVSENLPTWVLLRESPGRMAHVTGMGIAAILSFAVARRRLSPTHIILFIAYLYLGMRAERNLSLYLFVIGPIVIKNLNVSIEDLKRIPAGIRIKRWIPGFGYGIPAAVLLVLAGLTLRAQLAEPTLTGLAPFRVPVQATDILAKEEPDGRIFNSVRYGGYLMWHLYPGRQVFIDGRLIIRTPEQFGEYLRMLDDPKLFEHCRAKWNIRRAVLPTAVFMRYMPLVRELYLDPAWSLIYADGASALFSFDSKDRARAIDLSSRAHVDEVLARIERESGNAPRVLSAARLHLAGLMVYVGSLNRAGEVLAPMDSLDAKRYLAQCRYMQGRRDEAFALAEELLLAHPDDAHALNMKGRILLERGKRIEALECFAAVLRGNPYDKSARKALDELERSGER